MKVLILVVVDNGLVHKKNIGSKGTKKVLILVVVDNGLVLDQTERSAGEQYSLNPCCSGQWSRTTFQISRVIHRVVLILVVVDNGLVLNLIRHY